ncbi:MAG: TlpA disulfide reductase family protein [Thermoleophilaceae bacterium]
MTRRSFPPVVVAAVLGVLALIALLVYGLVQSSPDQGIDSAVARGERPVAPAFELGRLEGDGRGSLADYRGKVVVVNFWGSWCSPCRDESPLLERWHKRISAEGGTVLGVDAIDVTSDAQDFVEEFGLTYPMVKDTDEEVGRDYGVTGYPETFVVDREGRIVALKRGPVDDAFMREEVLPLVEGRS